MAAGLSPRTRGNRRVWATQRVDFGSIPANAGEPGSEGCPGAERRVYPRERGGTEVARLRKDMAEGLSPRTRGNHSSEIGV